MNDVIRRLIELERRQLDTARAQVDIRNKLVKSSQDVHNHWFNTYPTEPRDAFTMPGTNYPWAFNRIFIRSDWDDSALPSGFDAFRTEYNGNTFETPCNGVTFVNGGYYGGGGYIYNRWTTPYAANSPATGRMIRDMGTTYDILTPYDHMLSWSSTAKAISVSTGSPGKAVLYAAAGSGTSLTQFYVEQVIGGEYYPTDSLPFTASTNGSVVFGARAGLNLLSSGGGLHYTSATITVSWE